MSEEGKSRLVAGEPQGQNYYGTFQGVANYYPPVSAPAPAPEPLAHPVVGFPQPIAPPGVGAYPPCQHHHHYAYPVIPGYAVVPGRPLREPRLPFCGIGIGWLLFIAGFFLGGIPWYVGTFILLCVRMDYREKPGCVACLVATVLAVVALTLGVTRSAHAW